MTETALLPERDRRELRHQVRAMYLNGGCYELATAMHEKLEWPLYGLVRDGVVMHAFVCDMRADTKPTYFYDARGRVLEPQLRDGVESTRDTVLQPIGLGDLTKTRPINRSMSRRAGTMAELTWPELPWLHSSAERFVRFADALEKLCQEHGVYIRDIAPGCRPVLYSAYGDEGGFRLHPNVTGDEQYFLERLLPSS